ncbi:MAG: histidine kinase [Lachnospiraceae bacterium]|nr:histidine kinase [Lachnospiraceae bacterium]
MSRKPRQLQTQIICIFMLTFGIMLLANIYIFSSMRSLIDSMDRAYDGNRRLTEMRQVIDRIQTQLDDYMSTKDEGELNSFYENVEVYKGIIAPLSHSGIMTKEQIRENAIVNLSTEYIRSINKAVLSKKSGDVLQYQEDYLIARNDYDNLTSYMADLNTGSFQDNSFRYEKMYEVMDRSEYIYGFILVMMAALDILLLIILIRRLMKPLQDLVHTANEVGDGNLDITLPETQEYNEIGIVNTAFNKMIVSLKEYIRQFKQSVESESRLREKSIMMEASVKEAQLKYLQAQINPHFLFNTLNAGAQLAMLEDADRTYKYILRVADFFRSKIKNDEGISTISEELKIVDDYIYIINVRYSGEIHYTKDVDEKYLSVSVPSMILQPIVENCIKHGLEDIDREKRVDLSVYGEDENIIISIRDNGVGIPDDAIERILAGRLNNHDQDKMSGGVGLDNVITRLKVFYDSDSIVEITSVGRDMGTEIALCLPKEAKGVADVQDSDSRR